MRVNIITPVIFTLAIIFYILFAYPPLCCILALSSPCVTIIELTSQNHFQIVAATDLWYILLQVESWYTMNVNITVTIGMLQYFILILVNNSIKVDIPSITSTFSGTIPYYDDGFDYYFAVEVLPTVSFSLFSHFSSR